MRPEQFARFRDQMLWSLDDEPSGGWLASISAIEHLYGSSLHDASEVRGRLEALTETDLDDAVRAFLASVLYTTPSPEECSAVFPRVERASPPPKGKLKAFEPWNPMVTARLSISPNTAVFEDVPETRIALSLEDAAGLLKHPGGSRIIVGADGATLHVNPATWLHGDQAIALLDQHIPTEKHIGLEADHTVVPFEQPTWARRRARTFASLALDPYVVLVALLVTFPLVLLVALTTRLGPPAFTVWLLLGARCVFELTRSDK